MLKLPTRDQFPASHVGITFGAFGDAGTCGAELFVEVPICHQQFSKCTPAFCKTAWSALPLAAVFTRKITSLWIAWLKIS